MSEESDDGFLCSTCGEFESIPDRRACPSCQNEICFDCLTNKKEIIILKEWLDQVPNYCEKCDQFICGECVQTCYTCWNHGESSKFTCQKCSDVTNLDCKYHKWASCQECLESSEYDEDQDENEEDESKDKSENEEGDQEDQEDKSEDEDQDNEENQDTKKQAKYNTLVKCPECRANRNYSLHHSMFEKN